MVEAVRRGQSLRQVALRFGVSLSVVQYWLSRAGGERLDRVDWEDRPSGFKLRPRRVSPQLERQVLLLRRQLREESDLGEYGAAAIVAELKRRKGSSPSVSTVGRILSRCGALDGKGRRRHAAPPKGWYLPSPSSEEIDSFDIVEGLRFRGGQPVEVLTGTSVHGGLVSAWPMDGVTAKQAAEAILERWRADGLPGFAQFDNDTIFQGGHNHPDTVGRVTRLCLSLEVTPIFAPVREVGFQAAIENFNGRWQAKVWSRFTFPGFAELRSRSDRFIAACRERNVMRRESAPPRKEFPLDWKFDLPGRPAGRIIYIRRSDAAGMVSVLGRRFKAAPHWPNRLVRADVLLDEGVIRIYSLRRREPREHQLLNEVQYQLPNRRFQG